MNEFRCAICGQYADATTKDAIGRTVHALCGRLAGLRMAR